MIEQAGPPSKQVQAAKQVQELIKDGDDAVIVGIFSSEQDAAFEIYIEACEYQETLSVVCGELRLLNDAWLSIVRLAGNALREDFTFRHTISSEVSNLLKASPGQVVIVQPEKFRSKYEPASHKLTIKVTYV